MYTEVLLRLELCGIDNVWKLENFVSFRIAAFDMKIERYHFILMLNYLFSFVFFEGHSMVMVLSRSPQTYISDI